MKIKRLLIYSCIASWRDLEELILSGNRLQYLPDVANLRHLRVLRVHSNRLLTCPTFNKTASLKVILLLKLLICYVKIYMGIYLISVIVNLIFNVIN